MYVSIQNLYLICLHNFICSFYLINPGRPTIDLTPLKKSNDYIILTGWGMGIDRYDCGDFDIDPPISIEETWETQEIWNGDRGDMVNHHW